MDIENRTFETIARIMGVPADTVNADSSPDTIAQWDSLKQINLVLALEQEFGISFTEEQIVDMLSAGIIVEILKQSQQAG